MASNKTNISFYNNDGIKVTCDLNGSINRSELINWYVNRNRDIENDDSCNDYIVNDNKNKSKKE